MTVLEEISLFQRMTGSIKADIEAGKNIQALGKIELLEGELGIARRGYEPREEEPENIPATPLEGDIIDADVENK